MAEAPVPGPAVPGPEGPLAGRVAVVSGGGRGLGRSFCLALARQGARVVVNNRNRVVDADGRGPADHVASEITAAGGEAVADYADAADPGSGQAMVGDGPGAVGTAGHLRGQRGHRAGRDVPQAGRRRLRRGTRRQPARQRPAGPGRDRGDAAGRVRADHPGRLERRAARRRRAVCLRGQQGRPAGLRPDAGRRGRAPRGADQHAAPLRADPDDRPRHARRRRGP